MKSLVLLLSIFVGCAVAQETPNAPTGLSFATTPVNLSVSGLHIVGNQILNANNQAVQLRGVDVDGTEYMCLSQTANQVFDTTTGAPNNLTPMPVSLLQAWAVNIVRVPLNEDCWLNINPGNGTQGSGVSTGGATYQTAIENFVSTLTSNNIAVILDLQWVGPGTYVADDGVCNGQFAPAPDNDHAPTFWSEVATAFASNHSVIFDLYNEPWLDDTTTGWGLLLNGGTISGGSYSNCPTYTSVGTQSLVNTIRATGAPNIIDVPGVGFTDVLDQWLSYEPTDPKPTGYAGTWVAQLAAAWHSYCTPGNCQTCGVISCWVSVIQPIMAQVPIMTEEIGENDCQDTYVVPLMAWLDGMGGNYLAWAYNDTYPCDSFPSLVTSATSGTPTSFGVGIRNHLLAMSGQTPPTPPTVTFFTNTYPFGIAVGRSTNYTASDGTIYYPDVGNTNAGMTNNFQYFSTVSTGASITGTSDPTLYQTGRYGVTGIWDINVPNGNYTVTLGFAPYNAFSQTTINNPATASTDNAGEFGQDQSIQGSVVAGCVWSTYSGTNDSPNSTPASSCPPDQNTPVPTVDAATTVSYIVSVYNQQLAIQVAASGGNGRQTMLNTIKVVQNAPASIPPTPTGLSLTPGNAQVTLNWNASTGASSYNILRSLNSTGFYTTIGIPATNSYTDTGVQNFIQICYMVSAASAAGASSPTAYACTTPITTPAVPTGVGATSGNTTATINWTASTGATSYKVLRSTTSGSGYAQIATPNSATYNDTGLTNGTTYYYVIEAVNSAGTSANSSQVSATPSATIGVWYNVTPSSMAGMATQTVGADPANPGTLYTTFDANGIWKSTDYGQTWTGPVNTGTNGANITSDGGSGIAVGSGGIIYFSCIRGNLIGFFKSTDGGVNFTYYNTPLSTGSLGSHGTEQDLYYPRIDPYTPTHLLMTAHEQPFLFESFDGGQTWSNISLPSGMTTIPTQVGGTAFAFFVNTGTAGTPGVGSSGGTANTWLWIMQGTGGEVGTWRTTNEGATWTQVNTAEHNHGTSEIYQPNTTGDIFLPQVYGTATGYSATNAWGVLHSADYGQTWSLVGVEGAENVCTGTSYSLYCNNGAALAVGNNYEVSPPPGTGNTWTQPAAPSAWTWGTGYFLVVNDGTHNIVIAANWVNGIWRYIEP